MTFYRKLLKNFLATSSLIATLSANMNSTIAAQDTLTAPTGATNFLSNGNDWLVGGVLGVSPNANAASMIFFGQNQDMSFDNVVGNLGTLNLYGFDGQTIYITAPNSVEGIISDVGVLMVNRVTIANGGPLAEGGGGGAAKVNLDINIVNDTFEFNGNQLGALSTINLVSVDTNLKFSGDNSIINEAIYSSTDGNGRIEINANNVRFNGVIGGISKINSLRIQDNKSAILNADAFFHADGLTIAHTSLLTLTAGKTIDASSGNASINFTNDDSTLVVFGDIDTTLIGPFNSHVVNGGIIKANDLTAGQTLTLQGRIGNNSNPLALIEVKGGGALKLQSKNGEDHNIASVDITVGDGTVILNGGGNYFNLIHDNNKGTIIISDEGALPGSSSVVGLQGTVSSAVNPLKKILFTNTIGGPLVNVLLFGQPIDIYADSIETDTAEKGVLLFTQGVNIVDSPIGTALLPLTAIAVNANTTVELWQDVFLNQNLIALPYEIGVSPGAIVRIKGNVKGDIMGLDTILSPTPNPTVSGTLEFINPAQIIIDGNISYINTVNINGNNILMQGNFSAQTTNFVADSKLIFPGNQDRTFSSNIQTNGKGSIIANDMAAGKTLTIEGTLSDDTHQLALIEAKGGGTIKFHGGGASVKNIDITNNDGTVELGGNGTYTFNLVHDNGKGTLVVSTDVVTLNEGTILSSLVNPLKSIILSNPISSLLIFAKDANIYATSIDLQVPNAAGILVFNGGTNIIDSKIGTKAVPLTAVAAGSAGVTIDIKQETNLSLGIGFVAESTVRLESNLIGGGVFGVGTQVGTLEFTNTKTLTIDSKIGTTDIIKAQGFGVVPYPISTLQLSGKDVIINDVVNTNKIHFSKNNLPSTLTINGATTLNSGGVTTAGDLVHSLVIKGNFNQGTGSLGTATNRLKTVVFNDSVVTLANNVYAGSATVSNSTVTLTNDITIQTNITSNDIIFNLGTHTLDHQGKSKFTGNIKFTTSVDGNNIGNIAVDGNISEFDFSKANSATLILTANTPPLASGSTKQYQLFKSINNGLILSIGNVNLIVNDTNPFIKWTYNPNTFILSVVPTQTIGDSIQQGGGNNHDIKIGNILSGPVSGNAAQIQLNFSNMTPQQVAEAIARLEPTETNIEVENTNIINAQTEINDRIFNATLLVRPFTVAGIQGVSAGDKETFRYGLWANSFYGKTIQKKYSINPGYKANSIGITLGYDAMVNDDLMLGIACSLVGTNIKIQDQKVGDVAKTDTMMVSLYGLQEFKNDWFMQGIASFGSSQVKNSEQRNITATQTLRANSKHDSMSYSMQTMVGHYYNITSFLTITPMAGMRYERFGSSAYQEVGAAPQNLWVKRKASDMVEIITGARVTIEKEINKVVIIPYLHAFANFDFKSLPALR